MNAFRSSGPYQMRLSGEESRKSKARLRGSLDSAVAAIEQHHRQQLLAANESNCEVSISSARASVMVYDDVNKKWVPSGSSSGLSKVQLYHHQLNNTFRVVGRKLQDHEIVMNCAILRGLKYNQATVTFHQWRDNKQVYGLNFSSKDDADAFAKAMLQALDVLSNGTVAPRNLGPAVAPVTQQQPQPPPLQQQQQQQQQQMPVYQQQQQIVQQQPNGQYEEDMGYRTMTREDVAIIQERRMSQQNQVNGHNAISPSCPNAIAQAQQQQQQQQSGHHRTSSAPPGPAANSQQQQQQQQQAVLQQQQQQQPMPPAPPQPPVAPPAPPCPPGMMNFPGAVIAQQYAQSPQSQQCPSPGVGLVGGGGIYGTGQAQNGLMQAQQPQQQPSPYQYAGSQYGSRASLNSQQQYATLPAAMPQQQQQSGPQGPGSVAYQQYGPVVSQQPGAAVVVANPYGLTGPQQQQAYGPGPQQQQHQQTPDHNPYAPCGSVANMAQAMTSSAVPPPPPPMAPQMLLQQGGAGSVAGGAPPPPPPPPAPCGADGFEASQPAPDVNSLAAALQAAKLKKKQQSQSIENSGSSTSSSGSGGGNYGTLGRNSTGGGDTGGGGMSSAMMVEMAKTLARRRAAVEKKQPDQTPEPDSSPDKKSWDKNNSTISNSNSNNKFSNGAESPKAHRKRFGSASEDTLLKVNGINDGTSVIMQELETFKVELMKEVRKEFQKIKQEIVEAVRSELNRR